MRVLLISIVIALFAVATNAQVYHMGGAAFGNNNALQWIRGDDALAPVMRINASNDVIIRAAEVSGTISFADHGSDTAQILISPSLGAVTAAGDINTGGDVNISNPAANSTVLVDLTNDARTWQLRVAGGEGDRFRIYDATGTADPFQIEAGADNDALYIDSAGLIGINNANPLHRLHVIESGSSGMTAFTGTDWFFESDGNSIINIGSPNGFNSALALGSVSDPNGLLLQYNPATGKAILASTDAGDAVQIWSGNSGLAVEFNTDQTASFVQEIDAAADTDGNHIFGRIRLGNPAGDNAGISHYDHMSLTNYMIKQNANGLTRVNSPSGQDMELAINNTMKLEVESGGDVHIVQALDVDGNIELGDTLVGNVGNGEIPIDTATNGLALIRANTSDGSDDDYISLAGGGDVGTDRGGYLGVYGMEFTTFNLHGSIGLFAASHANSKIAMNVNGTNSIIIDINSQVFMAPVYADAIGTPRRDLFIKDDGQLGYVSSTRADKEQIEDITDAHLTKIWQLEPKRYERVDDPTNTKEFGLIAEDVAALGIPGLVSYARKATMVDERPGNPLGPLYEYSEDLTKPETVNYSFLTTILLREVQKLRQRVTTLEGHHTR